MSQRRVLIVTEFTISVYSSSHTCNSLFFGLIRAPLLPLFIYWHPQDRMGFKEIDRERKEERMRPTMRELHELLSTEIQRVMIHIGPKHCHHLPNLNFLLTFFLLLALYVRIYKVV